MNPAPGTDIHVVTALGMTAWEPEFISALRHPAVGLTVVRRCFEAVDLLAYVAATEVDGAVISEWLDGLDAEVIAQLHRHNCWVLAVVSDDEQSARARSLGADAIVIVDGDHPAGAARDAGASARALRLSLPEPDDYPADAGRVVCVWGPHGSAGRSTVALTVADEIARAGVSCALVDADPVAPSVDQLTGVITPASVTWAQRLAAQGRLTPQELLTAMPSTRSGLRILPAGTTDGVLRKDLWPAVLDCMQRTVAVTIIDMGPFSTVDFDDSDDVRLMQALWADDLITVGTCEPVGLARLLRFLSAFRMAAASTHRTGRHTVAITHMPRDPASVAFIRSHVAPLLRENHAGLALVDDDRASCLAARSAARPLAEAAPTSRLRRDLRALAAHIAVPAA